VPARHDRPVPTQTAEQLTARLHASFPDRRGAEDGGDERDGMVTVDRVDDESIRILLHAGRRQLRPGASVSGPTLFTLVDTVAWLLTLARLDPAHDALTSAVSIQFLRRPPAGLLVGDGTLLRMGRRSSVVDARVYAGIEDADARRAPVVQATVTYAPVGPVAG
jgi:uncharacterized protein (TIGR00369 family)